MADGDTGFCTLPVYSIRNRGFEDAGASGVNLEDQVFPKRCGHMEGKKIIPMEEMVKKIEAAMEAKRDKDFVINARTDAIAISGVDEAIKRGNAYAKAGADLIFVEAPTKEEDIKKVISSINAPVSINLLQGGKTPLVPIAKLQEWGAARVSIPVTSVMITAKALMRAFEYIIKNREISGLEGDATTFSEYTKLVGLDDIKELEKKYSI